MGALLGSSMLSYQEIDGFATPCQGFPWMLSSWLGTRLYLEATLSGPRQSQSTLAPGASSHLAQDDFTLGLFFTWAL